ncbi:unnamed protein product [Adineta steineri]|uniref:PITH domain-containing protein n=1 Tax=Adineta steineri TaxID=433720 RepID=A0A818SI06_9BILA|nr:unnamed protein product [Adineta steineri]
MTTMSQKVSEIAAFTRLKVLSITSTSEKPERIEGLMSFIWQPNSCLENLSVSNCFILDRVDLFPTSSCSLMVNSNLTSLSLDLGHICFAIVLMPFVPALEHFEVRLHDVYNQRSAFRPEFLQKREWPTKMTESQQKITLKKMKITTPTRIEVDVDQIGVTVATIATGDVSTCHFILLVGYFEHVRFALLRHTASYFPSSLSETPSTSSSSATSPPRPSGSPSSPSRSSPSPSSSPPLPSGSPPSSSSSPPDSSPSSISSSSSKSQKSTPKKQPKTFTPKSTMLKLLGDIVEDLNDFLPQLCVPSPELFIFECIKNVRVLIGGTVELTTDLIYEGFKLLNDNNICHKLKEEVTDSKMLHLIEQLCGNVEFLKPVTYYMPKTLIKLGCQGDDVPEPPYIFVKYDCIWNVVNLFIEFFVNRITYRLASMYINFNEKNINYVWQLKRDNIIEAQLDLICNSVQFNSLTKAVDFIISRINADKNSKSSIEDESLDTVNAISTWKNGLLENRFILKSNSNEIELILHVKFMRLVTLHSISFKALEDNGPKTVKLFLNRETVSFTDVKTNEPVEILEINKNHLTYGKPIEFKFIKSQRIHSITFFFMDNQSNSKQTSIESVVFFGTPVNTIDIQNS